MQVMNQTEVPEKDFPLRDDIRLLGRILGDTIREQEGEEVFDLVESVRQTSIRFHRDDDVIARQELESLLNGMTPRQTTRIIRAFSYFSHLANIAEDQHHIRRTRAHDLAGSAPRAGTIGHALNRAFEAGIPAERLRAFFAEALICPVLTAHPTEVRRKSSLNREMDLAQLLAAREHGQMTPDEEAACDESMRRAVLTLWQTSLLRWTKRTVIDEVQNGASFYDQTFLRELPRFYALLEDRLAAADPSWKGVEVPAFLRMGSWIGGDRDGNPFVQADIVAQALKIQGTHALSFYLEELHALGGELSLNRRNVPFSDALRELADRSPDRSPNRQDEPYRRAITGIYARLAATARALGHAEVLRHAVGEAPPYNEAAELKAELDVIHDSLMKNGSAILARGRLRHLRHAVAVFGFHLAGLDLRQNSDVHERTVADLFEAAAPGTGYQRA